MTATGGVAFAAPSVQARFDGHACDQVRSDSRFSQSSIDKTQRAAMESEIRTCVGEINSRNPSAWLILRTRDPRLFRPAAPSEVQVDGVTARDVVTALDEAASRDARLGATRPLIPVVSLLIAMGVVLTLYFVPSFVAASRGHQNRVAIFALNLLLGWTFLGWVGALVWSLTAPRRTA